MFTLMRTVKHRSHTHVVGECYWATRPVKGAKPAAASQADLPAEAFDLNKRPLNVSEEYWRKIPRGDLGKIEKTRLIQQYRDELRQSASKLLSENAGELSEYNISLVAAAVDRVIAEYCTGKNSRIGRQAPVDCDVVRLTEDDDMTTDSGLQKALSAVRRRNVLLWISLPCTGGSLWQRIIMPFVQMRVQATKTASKSTVKFSRSHGITWNLWPRSQLKTATSFASSGPTATLCGIGRKCSE